MSLSRCDKAGLYALLNHSAEKHEKDVLKTDANLSSLLNNMLVVFHGLHAQGRWPAPAAPMQIHSTYLTVGHCLREGRL